ncbi:TlpA disulfide reductase family protein [Pseudomonas indica]|uniref:Thiol-disulfide isomerase or thioredoxin n=1 Tax=Pseudomonas indica TaxID=137658 RepID=A0A1G8VZG7_9PSED|nr:TlpA disulfide reductase family protein [Pseudomonas indica]SDJ71442.1 Thiol-disulfide isomerase or thioredoxin [Pseudomonas indica]
MGTQLRVFMGIVAGLLLSGCAEDLGLDQHGRKVTAAELDGQWLVINYWAEWCKPCRSEIPQLNLLAERMKNQGVVVLGVNFDGLQGAELTRSSDTMKIDFRVLEKDPSERFQLPRNEVLPVTYLVDGQGRMRERLLGEQTAAGLIARLKDLRDEG